MTMEATRQCSVPLLRLVNGSDAAGCAAEARSSRRGEGSLLGRFLEALHKTRREQAHREIARHWELLSRRHYSSPFWRE